MSVALALITDIIAEAEKVAAPAPDALRIRVTYLVVDGRDSLRGSLQVTGIDANDPVDEMQRKVLARLRGKLTDDHGFSGRIVLLGWSGAEAKEDS